MMMVHRDNHHHHHRPFLPQSEAIGYGDIYAGGPTVNSINRPNKTTNINYDVFASSNSGAAVCDAVDSGGAVDVRPLQPFDISTTTNSTSYTAFKSPGEMAAASFEFPFTNAQWIELERQAMIYKYMKASIPVPPDLLIPLVAVSSHSALGGGAVNVRFSNRGDLEPGRCRRTDGKKWRCSRDVAPDQKYCERHMHRGRPRSRKPVELSNKKIRPSSSSSPTILNNNAQPFHQNQPTCFLDKKCEKALPFWPMTIVSSYKERRSLDCMLYEEIFPLASCDQQLQHLLQLGTNTGSSFSNNYDYSVLNQNYNKEPLNLNLYQDQPIHNSPEVAARGFIEAWSNHHNANSGPETSVSSKAKLSLSSIPLSIGLDHDDSIGPIHMGLGASEFDQNHEYIPKSHPSSWLAPASCTTSTPGGPLAEVLRPSKITTTVAAASQDGSNPSSTVSGDGKCCSPPL